MPRREIRSGLRPAISCPSKTTRPDDGGRSPDSKLMSVDLPAPLGPITAWTWPNWSSSETSLTAASPPKRFDRVSVRRMGSGTARLQAAQRVHLLQQSGDAARQQQHGENDEEAHRQQPMLGLI